MNDEIQVRFLRDRDHGGPADQAVAVAEELATFVAAAQASVHVAIYDFRLGAELAAPVVTALTTTAARGVEVRVAYDYEGKPAEQSVEAFAALGGDPAPLGTHEWVHTQFDGTLVELRPIDPGSQLMHDKYVIRDGATGAAVVWTGSTNFTDDAWTHQENNVITVAAADVAAGFERDFDQMWESGRITGSGAGDTGATTVGSTRVEWAFAPADGTTIESRYAELVRRARSRVVVASMVLTSRTILAALDDALTRGVSVTGIYDAGQMDPIVRQWRRSPTGAETAALFERVAGSLVSKRSEPYSPTSLHNFMHHKVLVVDDTVATGSFNLSRNATRNAENSLVLAGAEVAETYADAIAELVAAYGGVG